MFIQEKNICLYYQLYYQFKEEKIHDKKNYNWCRKAFGRNKDRFLIFKRSLWRRLEMEKNFLSLTKNIHQKHSAYVVLDCETLKTFLLRSSRRQRCPFPDTHTSMDQNREPKIDSQSMCNWLFYKGAKAVRWRKTPFSANGAEAVGCPPATKMNPDLTLKCYEMLTQKWILNLNRNCEAKFKRIFDL